MKILLRDTKTQLFKDRNGGWTSTLEEAAEFATLEAAGREGMKCGEDVVVLLKYDDTHGELSLYPVYCARK